MIKHDWDKILINRVVPDHVEQRKIKNELISNFSMIKEIWHYLQARSKVFPFIDLVSLIDMFKNNFDFCKHNQLLTLQLYNIALEVSVQGERMNNVMTKTGVKRIKRHQFFEILVRFSIELFTNKTRKSAQYDIYGYLLPVNRYNELTPS